MSLMILPTLLFLAALTTALMVLAATWSRIIPAYRTIKRQLDGVPDTIPVHAHVSAPALRPRRYGPFAGRAILVPIDAHARKSRQRVHFG